MEQWLIPLIICMLLLVIAFITDHQKSIIPNWLTVSAAVVGVVLHLIVNQWSGVVFSLAGCIIGFIVVYILYLFKAVGAGDVKLFAAIGSLCGLEFTLYSLMYSIVFAGLIGIGILAARQLLIKKIVAMCRELVQWLWLPDVKRIGDVQTAQMLRFPFMYAVLPGTAVTVYYFFIEGMV